MNDLWAQTKPPPEIDSDDPSLILEAAEAYRDQFEGDVDSIAITLGIRRANSVITSNVERALDSWDLGVDLSHARLSVLRAIYFGEDHRLTLNELGRKLKVSRTNVTNLMDGLERDDLVRRSINASDRRLIDAQLTEKGLRVCTTALPRIARLMEAFAAGFTVDERAQFASLLARLLGELSKQQPEED